MTAMIKLWRLGSIGRTWLQFGLFNLRETSDSRFKRTRGVRLRLALEKLGPIFVKAGQLLATRRDLLPDDIALELAKLQDQVPPFAGEKAVAIIETAFDAPIHRLFTDFDKTPIAAASIAQVHKATLPTGETVAVKVLRPGIDKQIKRDVSLLMAFAKLLQTFVPSSRRYRPCEVIAEIEQTLLQEIDLRQEAANATCLRRNFIGSPILYIPEIHWQYVRKNVLAMEHIHGIPIADISRLQEAGVDLKKLAENGVEVFFTQVLRDSFFHADMHAGNIFVDSDNPELACYIAVDFGIVGNLDERDLRYLAENLLAFFERDYARVAQLHLDSGWVPPETRATDFANAIRAVCEPIFGKPLKDISYGQLLLRLFQTAKRFNMEVQPQLLLLQKTLLSIEGLGRQIYPDLDLWVTAKPLLEQWLQKKMGLSGFITLAKTQLPYWLEKMPALPELLYQSLQNSASAKPNSLVPVAPPARKSSLALALVAGIGLSSSAFTLLQHNPAGWVLLGVSLAVGFIAWVG